MSSRGRKITRYRRAGLSGKQATITERQQRQARRAAKRAEKEQAS